MTEENTKKGKRRGRRGSVEKGMTEKSERVQGIYKRRVPHSPSSPLSWFRSSTLPFYHPAMARAPPPSGVAGRQCVCGCKTANIRTMNKHMKKHAQRLNIKTTHLASLTAVFHPKKQLRPSTTNAMDTSQDNCLAGPSGQADGTGVVPEVPAPQFNYCGTDDSDESDDSGLGANGTLPDSDSDEFESNEDPGQCKAGEGRGPLEFELRTAKAGDIHRRDETLIKLINC